MGNKGVCEKCEGYSPELMYVFFPANPDRMESWCPDCRLALAQEMAAKEPGMKVQKVGRRFAVRSASGNILTQL